MVGTGYVGLTTGAALASLGHRVVCADIDAERIDRLRQGHIPIVEEGLEAMVRRESVAGHLSFESDSAVAVAGADVVFLCVPT
ncbi:MAG: UDP-glucose 6-dehydrogenase, partial [Acidimicrobiia bacterium]|nr:UDP-glucose 6-dehydrogenase [Acidimicrobiia bacterium]